MLSSLPKHVEVIIIGAGPSATVIASRLLEEGIDTLMIEREQFPRFIIGESLLPEALNCLEEAGMLDAVESAEFQYKDGAVFATNEQEFTVNFSDSFSSGRSHAYQVPRADFDLLLADFCISKGAQICYQTSVTDIDTGDGYCLTLQSNGESRKIKANFLIDASGFGRVLAKKFGLESPSNMASRTALFCHIDTAHNFTAFDRNKILIAQTDANSSSWYWAIPFFEGHCSVGVVTGDDPPNAEQEPEAAFQEYLSRQNVVSKLVNGRPLLRKVGRISAYSASINSLHGDRFVILGNAGEFIDPIFSSGVTIALKSAVLAAPLVIEHIKHGVQPDWEGRFEGPLRKGIEVFRTYVLAWYNGALPNLIYSKRINEDIYRMICGVLSGYAWDQSNPLTRAKHSTFKALVSLGAAETLGSE